MLSWWPGRENTQRETECPPRERPRPAALPTQPWTAETSSSSRTRQGRLRPEALTPSRCSPCANAGRDVTPAWFNFLSWEQMEAHALRDEGQYLPVPHNRAWRLWETPCSPLPVFSLIFPLSFRKLKPRSNISTFPLQTKLNQMLWPEAGPPLRRSGLTEERTV